MGILEKCEKIGIELRRTLEGEKVINLLSLIKTNPQELTLEFFKLINYQYVRIHFFAVQYAIDILENNVENQLLGELVKSILAIDDIKEFGQANIPIGQFVEKLAIISFNNSVKYELPTEITVTPGLVRLSNSLTVECQRTNLVQRFAKEYYTDPLFPKAIKRFDELREAMPILPFSKEDRIILKTIKKEYPNTKVDLFYLLISVITYIKCMIFDSFYDRIYEVSEPNDVLFRKEKALGKHKLIKLTLHPNKKILDANTGWILKLTNNDGSISYAQIIKKQIKWTQTETNITIKALIYNIGF